MGVQSLLQKTVSDSKVEALSFRKWIDPEERPPPGMVRWLRRRGDRSKNLKADGKK